MDGISKKLHHAKKPAMKSESAPQSAFWQVGQGDSACNQPSPNWNAFLAMQRKAKTSGSCKVSKTKHIEKESPAVEIWFDDVDPELLEKSCNVAKGRGLSKQSFKSKAANIALPTAVKSGSDLAVKTVYNAHSSSAVTLTKYVALDCEMVGVGLEGKENLLARASIVNSRGECVYDKYVRPSEKVVDYRTEFSGVRAADLVHAPDYKTVQKEVADILQGRVLVGHALHNDLKTLLLSHPRKHIRDTSQYPPFRKLLKTKRPALRKLAKEVLKITIQDGEHDSVIDARTAMNLYLLHKRAWEKSLRTRSQVTRKKSEVFIGKLDEKSQLTKKKRVKSKGNPAAP